MRTIEELLETPYWIIDILPSQVPEGSSGQYFAVEEYYLQNDRLAKIKQKHIDLILKLNCYRDISLDEETQINPAPSYIARKMMDSYLCIMIDDSMIVSRPDETYLTVYDPDMRLLQLIKDIALSEGLYVWKPGIMIST